MFTCRIVDAFPTFLEFWPSVRHKTIDEQLVAWEAATVVHWPALLAMQKACYEEDGEDWRQIAREMVFPYLDQRVPGMTEAREHLLEQCEPVYVRAQRRLDLETDLVAVIHVGIGCGAGWVTTYEGQPAILFGVENAAEEGWTGPEVLAGLIAHEIGHVAHFHWREQRGLPLGSGPWWLLYAEGFAQRCEQVILDRDSWHMAHGVEGWQEWCRANLGWLAAEFLRVADCGESIRPFFGSWYELRGWKQTGYYLGQRVIEALEARMGLREIALLDEMEHLVRNELEALATLGG
ncbi:MAG: hypothetical protein ACK2UU_07300 [Anaerolineae bacterium]